MQRQVFALLLEIRNFRCIKTKGLKKKVNNELTLTEIHYNVKKYEKYITNDVLHFILKYVQEYKRKHGNLYIFSSFFLKCEVVYLFNIFVEHQIFKNIVFHFFNVHTV